MLEYAGYSDRLPEGWGRLMDNAGTAALRRNRLACATAIRDARAKGGKRAGKMAAARIAWVGWPVR